MVVPHFLNVQYADVLSNKVLYTALVEVLDWVDNKCFKQNIGKVKKHMKKYNIWKEVCR